MTVSSKNKFPNPFSLDEREVLKKWSNLSKSKKLLSPFQRKVLYEAGLFDEIFSKRFMQIGYVLDEFSELLDIPKNYSDMSFKLWQKINKNYHKFEAESGNSEFYLYYGEVFYYGLYNCDEDPQKALYWFKKAAKNNDLQALYNIGIIYLYGIGVDKNLEIAKLWFEKSSLQNHAESQYELAVLYLGEDLGPPNKKLGYSLLEKASSSIKQNNFQPSYDAIVLRGRCLKNGWGVKKNVKESIKYFKKASVYRSSRRIAGDGFFQLGLLYYFGVGVKQNFKIAFANFIKSVKKDNSDSKYYLAGMLYYGEGTEPDEVKAFKYFKEVDKEQLAEDEYLIKTYFMLGYCSLLGIGAKQNIKVALKNLNKANDHGHDEAKYWLGYYYFLCVEEDEGDNQDIANKAFYFLNKASKSNIEDSHYYLGLCYSNEIGVKQNYKKSLNSFKQSVLQNSNPKAFLEIGEIYYFGKGVLENEVEALKWFSKADEMGLIDGKFRVAEIQLNSDVYNKKKLIKRLQEVVEYEDEEDIWSEYAKKYIKIIENNDLVNEGIRKIERKGNILYPSIFQKLQNLNKNIDIVEDTSLEDNLRVEIDKPKSHLSLVKQSTSNIEKNLSVKELLERGENTHTEFKQTMQYDVNGNASGKPEASIIKTVVAFFNSQKKGGELIVGIKDNGDVVGLEYDFQSIPIIKKVNTNIEKKDKAKLWLRDLLRDNLKGYEDIITKISIVFEKYDNKDILRIKIPKSNVPIYPAPVKKLKEDIISQAFYTRDGNSVRVLEGAVRDRYIIEHFNK